MPPGATKWKPRANPWLIAVAVMMATFMEVMDTSIASVAVPYIAGSTASTTDEAEWVLTVYLVANALFLPSSTWFAEKYGRKRFLIFSIGVFTAASFFCGIAPTLGLILLARMIQGIGGGALQPLSQTILLESFPPAKQGLALGVYALGVVLAPVIGPALGGYLTDTLSWRWAFYINIPVGIAAMLLQSQVLEDPPEFKNANPGKLDVVGFVFLGIWVACMQFVLDKGQEDDWFGDARINWAIGIFAVSFALFLVREFLHKKPLVDLRVLRDRNLALGCVLIFMLGAALYSLTTVLPVFYQTLMGYDATSAGLAVSPRGIGAVFSSVLVGVLVAKMNPKWIVAAGFLVLGLGSFSIGELTLQISPTTLFWPILISGFGLAMVFVPLSKVALGTLSGSEAGQGSGLFNFLRNVGGSIGISIANTVAQRQLQSHRNGLVHRLSGASWIFQQQLRRMTELMLHHVGPRKALLRAYSMSSTDLNRQAQAYAYVDDFRYIALLCFACIPLAFFFSKPKAGAQGAG